MSEALHLADAKEPPAAAGAASPAPRPRRPLFRQYEMVERVNLEHGCLEAGRSTDGPTTT